MPPAGKRRGFFLGVAEAIEVLSSERLGMSRSEGETPMVTTVEGIFRDGRIELREAPPDVGEARVIVTFLPAAPESGAPSPRSISEANRRMLALLQVWRAEPLTSDEERVLDDFDAFQAQHPLRFTRPTDEP
jgi:hypothetical protein